MHYTYVLSLVGDKWYIGYTNNLKRRFLEHQREYKCKLAYYEAYCTEELARKREIKLKHYGSARRALRKRISA